MKNLIQRVITGVFFVALMVGAICVHPTAFLIVFSIVVRLTLAEFYRLMNKKQVMSNLQREIYILAGVYLFVSSFFYTRMGWDAKIFLPYLLFLIAVPISGLYTKQKEPLQQWAIAYLGQLYVAGSFSLLNWILFPIGVEGFHYLFVLAMFVFVWVNDSGAFAVGSLFGKRRLFERISPKKSWEGFWGGLYAALLVSVIFAQVDSSVAWYHWSGLSVFVVVMSVWGDLVESQLKRSLDVKDSGSLLPGHGGMLDRFDSVLFAIPATYVYIELFIRS